MDPTTTQTRWRYLERDPKSSLRQLSIKGRRIRARTIYGMFANTEEPRSVEEIASDYALPVAAVEEAIAYYQSDPPELRLDLARTEAIVEASGENDPGYKHHAQPKPIPPQVMADIRRKFG